MQIEKGRLLDILSQVKAWNSIVILTDSREIGCFDIIYLAQPFYNMAEPVAVNTITVPIGEGLFGGHEEIGKGISGMLVDIRDAIAKSDSACVIKDGKINGCEMPPPLSTCMGTFSSVKASINLACRLTNGELNIQGEKFASIVSDCLSFASQRENETALQGTCFDLKYNCLNAVSTDGVKLVKRVLPPAGNSVGHPHTIPFDVMYIPSKTEHPDVHIEFFDKFGSLTMYFEDFKFNSTFKVIDMQYPDYELAISRHTGGKDYIELDAPYLSSCLKKTYDPFVELVYMDGKITASTGTRSGNCETRIGIVSGKASRDMAITIRRDALLAVVSGAGKNCRLCLKDIQHALVWQNKNKSVVKMVMPMYPDSGMYDKWGFPIEGSKDNNQMEV